MLLVLTEADIDAVGPGVWNGWKAQLLAELYHEAEAAMSGVASAARASRVAHAKEILSERLANLPQEERESALAHQHESYWLAFDSPRLERNARLNVLARKEREPFTLAAELDAARGICEIAICARDHPGLFFQLAGGITASGGSILEAKAFTADDGWALDVFSVQDPDGALFGDPARLAKLRAGIAKALGGQLRIPSTATRRPGKRRAAAFAIRGKVNVDNDASASATVIEVEGADRPGLLFDIAHAIFGLGLSISSAIVATYGERVVDVFYVRDAFGRKVTGCERAARIEADLIQALAGGS
jgi:[protein-PII] uridylyltransferase